MSTLEILLSIFVLFFIMLGVSVNFYKLVNFDFSYYFFETAVYSGLWKGYSVKEYFSDTCKINMLGNNKSFRRLSDSSLDNLVVESFKTAKSGTYKNMITLEPIVFQVSLLKNGGQ